MVSSASAGLLSAGACVLMLHGCGDGGDTNSTTPVPTTTTTTTTAYFCPGDNESDLEKPSGAIDHNGASWRSMCVNKTEAHFLGLGDWGGDYGGHVWDNPGERRDRVQPADKSAAQFVARQMNWRAGVVEPDFVLNAGDNFYPGGIGYPCQGCQEYPCNPSDYAKNHSDPSGQFGGIKDTPFGGENLKGKPWLSVLGNHDYGGWFATAGWDVEIFHTWTAGEDGDWRMPGQYWHQHVKYHGFAVDFFMLDSNAMDARAPGAGSDDTNICGSRNLDGYECYGINNETCVNHFWHLWTEEEMTWLDSMLAKSTAEWKIIVTHFPGEQIANQEQIKDLHQKHGIDLIFTGHLHKQEFGWTNGIPWVLSGGGGGCTSNRAPSHDGNDQAYGFVDFTINATHLKTDFFSWGGPEGNMKEIIDSVTLLQGNHSTSSISHVTV